MVIDTSVLIALLLAEPETPCSITAIAATPRRFVSASSYLEAAIVMIARSGSQAKGKLDELLADLEAEIVPFTAEQAAIAIEAFQKNGKGIGRPAVLNFGDCFTYALAKSMSQPLLYKGDDFSQTDIATVGPQ